MPAHIIDSIFFKDLYGTEAMRSVFDDLNLLQKWLDVEVALAQVEAEIGLIPTYAAEEIARRARAEALDTVRLKQLIDQTVHPIVPLIRVLAEACTGDAGEYIHWGATTQDVMDTANVLQLKEAITILEGRLAALTEALTWLAVKYRTQLWPGAPMGSKHCPSLLVSKWPYGWPRCSATNSGWRSANPACSSDNLPEQRVRWPPCLSTGCKSSSG